jgi:nucleoside-diphosphate-sugar epimerase
VATDLLGISIMRLAVTGATGFLGRYLVQQLATSGHQLRCWYRPGSDRSGLEAYAPAIEWLPGRLGDADATQALVQGADAVVHAALARPSGPGFTASAQRDVLAFVQSNVLGSLQLFQTAFEAGVPRFVFISTCAVHDVILDDRPLDEAHPLWPKSHYGAHKAALEAFVHSYGLGTGWAICALRPTGIYGLAHPPGASRWYDLVGQVLRGERIATGHGGKEVHAADVARAVELLLRTDAKTIAGQAFNCYDRYVAEQHVAEIARDLIGSGSEIVDLNRGPEHQIDTRKLRALGMAFGGEPLLRRTAQEVIAAHQHVARTC